MWKHNFKPIYRWSDQFLVTLPSIKEYVMVAKYMEFAADLGSDDAVAWLRDYHEVDDARYHAYD